MTDKQKLKALEMLLAGASYREVARKFDVDRCVVEKMFRPVIGKRQGRPLGSFYPNLREWMDEHGYSSNTFAARLGCSQSNMAKLMRDGGNPQKNVIDSILELTGMTYEECFAKEKAPEDAATSIKG
jgi:transposase-like protein